MQEFAKRILRYRVSRKNPPYIYFNDKQNTFPLDDNQKVFFKELILEKLNYEMDFTEASAYHNLNLRFGADQLPSVFDKTIVVGDSKSNIMISLDGMGGFCVTINSDDLIGETVDVRVDDWRFTILIEFWNKSLQA